MWDLVGGRFAADLVLHLPFLLTLVLTAPLFVALPASAHVVRFGSQVDSAGIIAPSADADRAIRYLTNT